jgi:glycosyltransferase involved in cell wall biosynthesis
MSGPSITVVMPVYNAEEHVAESIAAVLAQTRPPDEVIVVDDGCTDGTLDVLAPFRSEIRVISQQNRGHAGAFNTGFAAARGDYVARCDADDVWNPDKLARQHAALVAHPEIDIAAGAAWVFGQVERLFGDAPGDGILDLRAFAPALYRGNMLCASSTVIRRAHFERLGPFVERLACEDYDFWLKSVRAGAVFHYDPAILLRYRQHAGQVTRNLVAMYRATYRVHGRHADVAGDRRLVGEVLAYDRKRIGRLLAEDGDGAGARAEYVAALRHRADPEALAWAIALSVPERARRAVIGASRAAKRGVAGRSESVTATKAA